jgi:hypothetical protein
MPTFCVDILVALFGLLVVVAATLDEEVELPVPVGLAPVAVAPEVTAVMLAPEAAEI